MQNLAARSSRVNRRKLSNNVEFKTLNGRLLSQSYRFLADLFPNGYKKGPRFYVGDLAGSKGKSLVIHIEKGFWIDFATDQKGGDLISLYAAVHNIPQSQALIRLNQIY